MHPPASPLHASEYSLCYMCVCVCMHVCCMYHVCMYASCVHGAGMLHAECCPLIASYPLVSRISYTDKQNAHV